MLLYVGVDADDEVEQCLCDPDDARHVQVGGHRGKPSSDKVSFICLHPENTIETMSQPCSVNYL